MATRYKGFWLIVGMTVAAVFLANSNARKPSSSGLSTRTSSTSSNTPVFPSEPTPQPTKPQPQQSLSETRQTETARETASTESGTSNASEQASTSVETTPNTPPSNAVARSIEPEIRSAFEKAVTTALAIPAATATPPETVQPDAEGLPPLETREVSTPPTVFDEQQPGSAVSPETALPPAERVVTTTNLNLREGPAPEYLKVETLTSGTLLIVLEKEGKWWHVRSLTSGNHGWVNGTFLKPAA